MALSVFPLPVSCGDGIIAASDSVKFARIRGNHITPNTPDPTVLKDLEMGRRSGFPGTRGGIDELAATWFREAGVTDVSRAAAAKARIDFDG